ncbi:Na+/H+ antiporter NhaA [Streptomyces sp. NPDC005435]|uniref:Na+/H+ antiporter NhaA n=1 Tax=Streptomyces sp. NPDC005435 TaxID=3154464 RepID=UPI0034520A59
MTTTTTPPAGPGGIGQTVRSDTQRSPLRDFLRTETASAVALVAAAVAALVWANAAPGGYERLWKTPLTVRLGSVGVGLELREWVNSGLMALFFFVVGLEARREFDMGELRQRSRMTLPLVAGLMGMVVPVLVFLAFAAAAGAGGGWGVAMSTDTAFALGTLALLGRRLPEALRTFLLTVAIVDDVVALAVIAFAYSGSLSWLPLLAAAAFFAAVLGIRRAGVRHGVPYFVLALGLWVALLESGVDPVVTGLLLATITYAYPASRTDLERTSGLFRLFREQPTPELERSLRQELATVISPNERLEQVFHPWASYVIVPLFALANAGVHITWAGFTGALTSRVTVGILISFVLGKPLGIVIGAALTTWVSRGRLRPQVGWGAVLAGGSASGVAFTVSLLIATLAFDGERLTQAKYGILITIPLSFALTWLITVVIRALPASGRARALMGTGESIVDLVAPVDPERDHIRGPRDAPVTVVKYGDFECPYCAQAEPMMRRLRDDVGGDIRFVWRHLPLDDVHPRAKLAAEASEAAARQGAFWPMHDVLLSHQGELSPQDLLRHAEDLGLDVKKFERDLRDHVGALRVAEDVETADRSGVAGSPTFFVNGRLHRGAYDLATLTESVRAAQERAAMSERTA